MKSLKVVLSILTLTSIKTRVLCVTSFYYQQIGNDSFALPRSIDSNNYLREPTSSREVRPYPKYDLSSGNEEYYRPPPPNYGDAPSSPSMAPSSDFSGSLSEDNTVGASDFGSNSIVVDQDAGQSLHHHEGAHNGWGYETKEVVHSHSDYGWTPPRHHHHHHQSGWNGWKAPHHQSGWKEQHGHGWREPHGHGWDNFALSVFSHGQGFMNDMWHKMSGWFHHAASSTAFITLASLALLVPAVLAVAIGILYIPVPLPTVRCARSSSKFWKDTAQWTKVLSSDECLERISCEISRSPIAKSISTYFPRPQSNSPDTEQTDTNCRHFKCKALSKLMLPRKSAGIKSIRKAASQSKSPTTG